MIQRGSLLSYGCVALVSVMASAIATSGIGMWMDHAAAQPAPPGTFPLLTQALADLPGREVRISLLDRPPGNSSMPHRHPGHHTFGYIVEGTYELGIDGQATRILKAGDTFYEPPGALHSVSRNPSAQQNMKIVVFMVADQRNPSTVNE